MQNEIDKTESCTIKIKIQQVRNKKVTKISNMPEPSVENLTKLLQHLKKKLACGGSINEDSSIVLQGDKSHTELIKLLKEQFGEIKIDLNGKIF